MKILCCGDVVGRSGRDCIKQYIPKLRSDLALDFVMVNGENAAHGFGINPTHCREFFDLGVDVITSGNHIWDQKEIIDYIQGESRLLRPSNYPEGTPGKGVIKCQLKDGREILILNIMGRLFMDPLDDPFNAVEKELQNVRLGKDVAAIVVDFHAETTSEKNAMGNFLDGRVSIVFGTHTHIPTSDTRILSGGTGYQTDLGMCGDYDSVIGMNKDSAISKFRKKIPSQRLTPADNESTLCAIYADLNDENGLVKEITPIRIGGLLTSTGYPSLD